MATSDRSQPWTWVGIALGLLAVPLISFIARRAGDTTVPATVLLREAAIFAAAGAVVLVLRRGERLGWSAIGLGGAGVAPTLIWGVAGAVACTVAGIAVALACQALGVPVGDGPGVPHLPPWLMTIVVIRAGIVEELCYRGYAIGALGRLGAPRWLAIGLPLLLFAGFHYPLGLGGVLVALTLGAILTALYLWRRNLAANMLAHFLVDFVPNVLLPS